jgi:Uma2 family endonuclease
MPHPVEYHKIKPSQERSMSTAGEVRCSPAEYLEFERRAEYKHEYIDGQIHAMAGATRSHVRIVTNLSWRLSEQLEDGPCEVFGTDMRVRIRDGAAYVYPDLVVACGDVQFDDAQLDTLLNPTVVVEVLSSTTELKDRGRKFELYRRLPTLREYVLVSQDRVLIECYVRSGEDWILSELDSLEQTLTLSSIGCSVPLAQIYARVEFPPTSLRISQADEDL